MPLPFRLAYQPEVHELAVQLGGADPAPLLLDLPQPRLDLRLLPPVLSRRLLVPVRPLHGPTQPAELAFQQCPPPRPGFELRAGDLLAAWAAHDLMHLRQATRLHLLWEGVAAGKISMNRFVEITSTAPAKIFGMFPKKGTVAVGSDADIVIFDPARIRDLSTYGNPHQFSEGIEAVSEITSGPDASTADALRTMAMRPLRTNSQPSRQWFELRCCVPVCSTRPLEKSTPGIGASQRSGCESAYWIGSRMSGGLICANTDPSTNSTSEWTIDCGCNTTPIRAGSKSKSHRASMISSALFISVAESMVIFGPIRHVG